MSAISINNLKKYYKYGIRGLAILALDGVSFDVEDGEVFGLVGPNGAGKSTTIKILLGLLKQSSGDCRIFGKPLSKSLRRNIGYLPEAPYFYKFLSGFELVKFYARLSGLSNSEAKTAAMKAINLVGLDDAADRQIALYSKGMVQRAGLAQAIVHNPKLVILDEPASGLDPVGASDMANIIRHIKDEGKTVLLCSHQMNEVENLCSRVAILSRGKIAASGRLDDLLSDSNSTIMRLDTSNKDKLEKLAAYASELGVKIGQSSRSRISLDDYFRKIVSK